jgi:penicillin-binding protein 1A
MYLRLINAMWLLVATVFLGLCGYVMAVSFNVFNLFGELPNYEALEKPKTELATEVLSEDGIVLGRYYNENRSRAAYHEIGKDVVNALIATEDVRFYAHSGIDFKGTFAILFYLLKGDNRGSSTLSQQLAKNLFNTRRGKNAGKLIATPLIGKVIAKTKEWILAIKIERAYTKDEILTMYLNTVDFSANSYGIKIAAKTYFGTSPDSLTVSQAAVLIGMLKSPTYYSPILNPENALRRRNTVMQQMVKYNYLSESQYNSLKQIPINLSHYEPDNHSYGLAPHFRSYVYKMAKQWCDSTGYDLNTDGLKIYTTIDSRMQQYAEDAITEHMKSLQAKFFAHWKGQNPWRNPDGTELANFLKKPIEESPRYKKLKAEGMAESRIMAMLSRPVKMKVFSWYKPRFETDTLMSPLDSIKYYKHFLRTSLVSIDPKNGFIKAWVGGINHKYFKYDNVKQGKRQPGSTFKAVVYSAAIDNNPQEYNPCTSFQDVPQTITLPDGKKWTPSNSGDYSGETYTLRQAMGRSINTAATFLMRYLSPKNIIDYARKLGIESKLDSVPALCLGISDISLLEMTSAYSTFANQGTWVQPVYITRIEDKSGKVLYSYTPKQKEVISEATAYLMTYMLRGSVEEEKGTARSLAKYNLTQGNEIGGKTGTTNNNADGWFIGITPNLVTGVWTGGEDRSIHFRTTDLGAGGKVSLPSFALYMQKVYQNSRLPYQKSTFQIVDLPDLRLDCMKTSQEDLDRIHDENENADDKKDLLKELNE